MKYVYYGHVNFGDKHILLLRMGGSIPLKLSRTKTKLLSVILSLNFNILEFLYNDDVGAR